MEGERGDEGDLDTKSGKPDTWLDESEDGNGRRSQGVHGQPAEAGDINPDEKSSF